jgi:hypothetical protein
LGGDQAFAFLGTAAFTGTGAGGEVRYEQAGGNTFVYADVNGSPIIDSLIRVTLVSTRSVAF